MQDATAAFGIVLNVSNGPVADMVALGGKRTFAAMLKSDPPLRKGASHVPLHGLRIDGRANPIRFRSTN